LLSPEIIFSAVFDNGQNLLRNHVHQPLKYITSYWDIEIQCGQYVGRDVSAECQNVCEMPEKYYVDQM
jgi:hypothetical protein